MTQINLSMQEIYAALCQECKDKIVKLVSSKLGEYQIKEALEKEIPPPKAQS